MYKVIVRFTDLQDNNHPYEVGDTYPREGYSPSAWRYRELSSTKNKRGIVLIEKAPEPASEADETVTEIMEELQKYAENIANEDIATEDAETVEDAE